MLYVPAPLAPPTKQSYIQSRGRARMHNSELLLMVQQGVQEQEEVRRGCRLPGLLKHGLWARAKLLSSAAFTRKQAPLH